MSKFLLIATLVILGTVTISALSPSRLGNGNCLDFDNGRSYLKLVRSLYCAKDTGAAAVKCAWQHIGVLKEDGSWENIPRILKIFKRFFSDRDQYKIFKPKIKTVLQQEFARLANALADEQTCKSVGNVFAELVLLSHQFECIQSLSPDPAKLFRPN